MNTIELKFLFQEKFLPKLFLHRTNYYIDAIKNGNETYAIEDFWDDMIKDFDCAPECYPLEFSVRTSFYDDNIYFSIIEMPETPIIKVGNISTYAIVVFDANGIELPRYFLGRPEHNPGTKRSIFIREFYETKDFYRDNWLGENNHGFLCKRDEASDAYTSIPVARKDERQAFIERVIEIYKAGE